MVRNLQVGRYLKIAQGNNDFTVVTIRNLKGANSQSDDENPIWQFRLECQAIGTLVGGKDFERTSVLLPVPTELVYAADHELLDILFSKNSEYQFPLGKLSINEWIFAKSEW